MLFSTIWVLGDDGLPDERKKRRRKVWVWVGRGDSHPRKEKKLDRGVTPKKTMGLRF